MKKLIFGIVIGAAVMLPVGAFAWSSQQVATPFRVAECEVTNGQVRDCTVQVSKFNDGSTSCYVAYQNGGDHDPSISCVRTK